MDSPFRVLRNILELEARKGFSDQAVVGGLDTFWRIQKGQIQGNIKDPSLLKLFRSLDKDNFNYRKLDIKERQKWVQALIELVDRTESSARFHTISGNERGAAPFKTITPSPLLKGKGIKGEGSINNLKISLDSPLVAIKGIGLSLARKFNKLGVEKLCDLLYFFPRRHLDYSQVKSISQLEVGKEQTIIGIVWEANEKLLGQRKGTEAIIGDDTGNIRVAWFNQPYLARRLKINERICLSGRVTAFRGQKQMEAPEWDPMEGGEGLNTGRLVPLYPLTEGLYQRQVRNIMSQAVQQWARLVTEFLPQDIKQRHGLMNLSEALVQAHLPDSLDLKDRARTRLAFDELLLFQLGMLGRKYSWQEKQVAPVLRTEKAIVEKLISSLSFQLTQAQQRALGEILKDMDSARPMGRMLQGDVGSGKTVLAAAALLVAVCDGHQAVIMAPTEILAEQHFHTLTSLFQGIGEGQDVGPFIRGLPGWKEGLLTLSLLTGSMSKGEKEKVYDLAREGNMDIIVGTHALIQEGLSLSKLGLAVIDEQHRFGVEQRSSLRQKGFNPHILVMTATPIPRTLALTLFGDLDLSVLDQMPPGRMPVKTRWLNPEEREKAYEFIRKKMEEGQQAYIICPRIEESDNIETRAAIAEYRRLSQDVFPDIRLGLLHGKMPAAEKEATMRSFKKGEIKILVSTSVVEVGIDVPQATVMLVEGAELFGLSQLHQFRGRVGRGTVQSYCLLLSDSISPEARERLSLIEKVHDGFLLAEEDLKLRGPGEFFGTRQSGMPDLAMAKLSDVALLEKARQEAIEIFKKDPRLSSQEHRLLARQVRDLWKIEGELS